MLSKSDIQSYSQCVRKLWLEKHTDWSTLSDLASERRMREGIQVGEHARRALGPVLWPSGGTDKVAAAQAAIELLKTNPGMVAVEVPMAHNGLYARADALIPATTGYVLQETKASAFPLSRDKSGAGTPDAHLVLDVAIQAWVMTQSGIPLERAELNLLDNRWKYPGDGDYSGMFRQLDVTAEVLDKLAEIPLMLGNAQAVLRGPMPSVQTGRQCSQPHACPFFSECKKLDTPGPEHPIELLPDSAGKALAKKLKADMGYISILDPSPAELTGKAHELYVRMQQAHRMGKAIMTPGAEKSLAALPWPRYYFDFEGIDLAMPAWKGVRPYEQIPFQWSCHIEDSPGQFRHAEFLDFSGKDPSLGCIEAMRSAIDPADNGPILVYFATYEKGRLRELAERHPEHSELMQRYIDRVVDLLPLVKAHYYHPAMQGSFSIKKVLPTIAPDLDYGKLEQVQDGVQAQLAWLSAAFDAGLSAEEKARIDQSSRCYCRQDTWAMVEVAWFLAGAGRPQRPKDM